MTLEKPCKIWTGALNEDGYGMRKVKILGIRYNVRVHRQACIDAHGPPPAGKNDAMHLCNNRACYEPTHLQWGSRWDNMQHAKKAGTIYRAKGERNGKAKLGRMQIGKITRKNTKGEWLHARKALAAEFGIKPQTVSKIRLGQRWRHL